MIPFNKPFQSAGALEAVSAAWDSGHVSGDGAVTRTVHAHLERMLSCERALLVHSGTAALEMAALLSNIGPGDEVIVPSYTFVSTANAFVLRGATPVFVDVRPDTLNIDPIQVQAAITPKTRAVVPVHYAGVGCDMDALMDIAKRQELLVIEDAAQGIMARYRGKPLGAIGQLGAYSFHETKNIISGEGGALLVNAPQFVERAEIMREKGTNRSRFFRGQVDKYTWVDLGSSYLPSDIIAAFLLAQLQQADEITERRRAIWQRYHDAFGALEASGRLRRPVVPDECFHNGHLYYLLLRDLDERTAFIDWMRTGDIQCVFHYVPLHSSPMGQQVGRVAGCMTVTDSIADRLVRLPLWLGLESQLDRVIERALDFFHG